MTERRRKHRENDSLRKKRIRQADRDAEGNEAVNSERTIRRRKHSLVEEIVKLDTEAFLELLSHRKVKARFGRDFVKEASRGRQLIHTMQEKINRIMHAGR